MNTRKMMDMPVQETVHKGQTLVLDKQRVVKGRKGYWLLRRGQDVILSLLAMIALFPLMLLIALLIYMDDPKGSPLFSQIRVGKDGKEFKFYKFRTMCVDAEAKLEMLLKDNHMDGPAFKLKNDPRITRIGRFLRRSSLDELPQLYNILKGDMSLVGPRPAVPREVEQYDAYQRQRLMVTPGLTCYWQIQPNRNDISFDEWMELDLRYIRERSFLVDWKIILGTFKAVLNMEGV